MKLFTEIVLILAGIYCFLRAALFIGVYIWLKWFDKDDIRSFTYFDSQ